MEEYKNFRPDDPTRKTKALLQYVEINTCTERNLTIDLSVLMNSKQSKMHVLCS